MHCTGGQQKKDGFVLDYEIKCKDDNYSGQIFSGEMKLLKIPYEQAEAILIPGKGLDIGAGVDEQIICKVKGGVVGIILDGRGRQPFTISKDINVRIDSLVKWSSEVEEYPEENLA